MRRKARPVQSRAASRPESAGVLVGRRRGRRSRRRRLAARADGARDLATHVREALAGGLHAHHRAGDDHEREQEPDPRPERPVDHVVRDVRPGRDEHAQEDDARRRGSRASTVTSAGEMPNSSLTPANCAISQARSASKREPRDESEALPHARNAAEPVDLEPREERHQQKQEAGAEHDLRSCGELGDVHFALFPFGVGCAQPLASLRTA